MNNLLKLTIILMLFSTIAFSQVKKEDTIKTVKPTFNIFKFHQWDANTFEIYSNINFQNDELPLNTDPHTIWLWTSTQLSNNTDEKIFNKNNFTFITLPLYEKFIENSKFNPVRYFLGMAQLTAAGYLAYRSIKKYGLWK